MNKGKAWAVIALCLGFGLLSGCGGEEQQIFEQAERNLETGAYENALQSFQTSVENGVKLPLSYRGAGIASLRMGDYETAIGSFTSALNCERVGKALQKDILTYRATAELLAGQPENAMADCQTLARDYEMDADTFFLTGKVALSMDGYDEAAHNFEQSFGEDSTYDRAIQIYEAYLEQDMEADGTRYLEAALSQEAADDDRCARGQVYYYMQDYESAREELISAANDGSTEAVLLLGMVYMAQNDISNARAMYQEFVDQASGNSESSGSSYRAARGYNGLALCDMAEGSYESALANIASGLASAEGEDMQSLLYNEMVVYEKMLDFSTALQKAQAYLEMYPGDTEMEKELIFLKSRTGTAGAAESTEAAEAAGGAEVTGETPAGAAEGA